MSPTIPLELEREILVSALERDLSNGVDLLLVARRVAEWLKPVFYETVIIHQYRRWPPQLANASFKSEETHDLEAFKGYGYHVHNLLLSDVHDSKSVLAILQMCPNLRNLAFLPANDHWTDKTSILNALIKAPIRKLSIDLTKFEPFDLPSSSPSGLELKDFFSKITHLDIFVAFKSFAEIGAIVHFTSLSHLALVDGVSPQLIGEILRNCPNLLVLVSVAPSIVKTRLRNLGVVPDLRQDTTLDKELKDKVVAIWCARVSDWEKGVKGKDDIWALAEMTVNERKNGLTKSPRDNPDSDWY
ncbi:hypothetical protein BDN72DRAFT_961223 [Pluteus cervinus]|uniref:Uncharacterized protein n=1 Tax=Pluteus cervinus TaxID=181527 RepID=A0ACD3APH3_9AGAR|nr:hypothetical protein BDN72DRAFT_961223 [Pluteus cervinus]